MDQVFKNQNTKNLCVHAKEKRCNELEFLLKKSHKNIVLSKNKKEKRLWNY